HLQPVAFGHAVDLVLHRTGVGVDEDAGGGGGGHGVGVLGVGCGVCGMTYTPTMGRTKPSLHPTPPTPLPTCRRPAASDPRRPAHSGRAAGTGGWSGPVPDRSPRCARRSRAAPADRRTR